MNWEELSAISTFLTLIVIAATAIAAVLQLRHMRAGNAIVGFLGMMDRWAGSDGRQLQNYVFGGELARRLNDAEYCKGYEALQIDRTTRPEVAYLDFWESLGMFVKLSYFPEDAVFESGGPTAILAWEVLKPVIARIRRRRGPTAYDNFEYLVSRALIWEAKHPGGYFPHNTPRLPVEESGTHVG